MKNKTIKKYMTKKALPLIVGGAVVLAGATGAYFYANNQGNKLSTDKGNQSAQTKSQSQNQTTSPTQTKGDNINTGQSTTSTTDTPASSATIGDISFQITIDDPAVRTTASAYFYGPAGTYGVEKLVNGSWATVVAKFSYPGSGGYKFDTISSNTAETHYRVFSLSGDTRAATSGDTVIKWSLVNENGIYTVPIAR